MVPGPSSRSALFSFLQWLRSIVLSHKFRTFILRCLLFCPRILRNLKKVWSWYFQTSSSTSDGKKTKGNINGPFPTRLSRKHEDYNVVCASRAFEGADEQSLRRSLRRFSDGEEPIQLEPVIGRSPNVLHSPSSSYPPSLQEPPSPSTRPLPTGNPNNSMAPSRPETPLSTMELIVYRSDTPVSWTHPRATSRQFTGSSSRSHSRRPSPSPSASLFRRRFSRPDTPSRMHVEFPAHPTVIQELQGSPDVSGHAYAEITVQVEQPSAPGSPVTSSTSPSRLSPVQDPTQSLPTRHQLPSSDSVNPSVDSSRSREQSPSIVGVDGCAYHSQGGLQAPRHEPSFAFPEHSVSRVSIQISTTAASNTQPDRSLKLMHSEQVSRYVNPGNVERKKSNYSLAAKQVDLSYQCKRELRDSGEWVPVVHPGGALYFYHEGLRIFTDVYMYDRDLREEVLKSAEQFGNEHLPTAHYDLVLDRVETKDKKIIWQYYYVDHDNRTLFWLKPYPMRDMLRDIPGVERPDHIKFLLEALYWVHWSLYPIGWGGRNFPDDASEELLGVLLSSSIDSLTSEVSTAPYSVADMQTMRDLIKEAQKLGTKSAHAINSIARLHSICARWRFFHFHGQKTSRQNKYKSIYEGGGHERTILIWLISPFLFFLPDVHLRELAKVWTDEVIIKEDWKNFMGKLVSEWVEFVLYATVMLTANVAFLAIQGVIVVPQSGSEWIRASHAHIASSISLVFSIGSIITGLLLIRRNRTMATQDAATASDYLDRMKKPCVYLEPLAIIFSLAYALLMWSVCAFFVALLCFSFQIKTTSIRVSVGVAAIIVTALIFWTIISSWDSGEGNSYEDELIDNESRQNTT